MAQMSVEQFAHELGMIPSVLLEQLQAAGVKKVLTEDNLTEQDKAQLLDYLRKTHGAKVTKDKVTLTRRQTSEIRKADSMGRARTIQVVRKRRVITKSPFEKDAAKKVSGTELAEKTRVSEPIINAEELALREVEAKKQAELIARQTAEIQRKKLKKTEAEKPEKDAIPVAVKEKIDASPAETTTSQAGEVEIKKASQEEGKASTVQDELIESGYSTYERVVQFPFWDEYGEQIKSKIADIKNLGGPEAGMITAGKFLEHFTLDEKKNPAYPYIHLDIAGVAYHHSEKNYRGVEGSGVGVRLLFDFFSKKAKKK